MAGESSHALGKKTDLLSSPHSQSAPAQAIAFFQGICAVAKVKIRSAARQSPIYSCRKLSTGSSCAARVAGNVPKMTPTSDDTTIAMIADSPEIGMLY